MTLKKRIEYAIKILEKRSVNTDLSAESRFVYSNAAQIIEHALFGNVECLREFDREGGK